MKIFRVLFLVLFFIPLSSHGSLQVEQILEDLGCRSKQMCKVLKKTLKRDSTKKCLPSVEDINNLPVLLPENKYISVTGSIKYAGVAPGPYGYHVIRKGRKVIVLAMIHFNSKKITEQIKQKYSNIFKDVGEMWSKNNPFDFELEVQFKITDDPKYAFVRNVGTKEGSRGPYFKNWDPFWWFAEIFHESGHLLGLDDEYNYIADLVSSNSSSCSSKHSIMCTSSRFSKIFPSHYYLFLRRALCL